MKKTTGPFSAEDLGEPPLHDPKRKGYDAEGREIGLIDWAGRKAGWECKIWIVEEDNRQTWPPTME